MVQALYFTVVTLTTIGYGDLAPTSSGTQIFRIVFILIGLGVFLALLTSIAQQFLKRRSDGSGSLPGRSP